MEIQHRPLKLIVSDSSSRYDNTNCNITFSCRAGKVAVSTTAKNGWPHLSEVQVKHLKQWLKTTTKILPKQRNNILANTSSEVDNRKHKHHIYADGKWIQIFIYHVFIPMDGGWYGGGSGFTVPITDPITVGALRRYPGIWECLSDYPGRLAKVDKVIRLDNYIIPAGSRITFGSD